MSDHVRLLGRGWEESLIGAFEKPPAMPEDIYFATTVTVTAGKYTSVQNSPVVDPKNTHRSRYLWLYDYHH